MQCTTPCSDNVWDLGELPEYNKETLQVLDIKQIPMCQKCNKMARPNVSLFNDDNLSFVNSRNFKQKKNFLNWLKKSIDLDLEKDNKRKMSCKQESPKKKTQNVSKSCHLCNQVLTKKNGVFCSFCNIPFCGFCVKKYSKNSDFSTNWKCFICQGICGCLNCTNEKISEPEEKKFSPSQNFFPAQKFPAQKKNRLLILEIGCGISAHSLRIETELLLDKNDNVSLVRINPSHSFLSQELNRGSRQVSISLGAQDALLKIFDFQEN